MLPLPSSPLALQHAPACSLGCAKNTVDGEVLLGDLFRSGFEITDAQEDVRWGWGRVWWGMQGRHAAEAGGVTLAERPAALSS